MSSRQTYFQQLAPREAELAWRGMKQDFQRIDQWNKAGQDAYDTASDSLLGVVDAMTEPHQVSHLLGYLLHTAVDHLHALKALLIDAKAQHTFAPFTLIRGAIEAASTALWLLQEGAPQSVVHRAMTLEHMNLADQRKATRTVDPTAGYDQDRLEVLCDVLARNQMKIQEVNKLVTVTKIIQDASQYFELPNSYLTWQMCSAAAHGRPWAKQHLTLFEAHDDDGFSKTLSGQLSSNDLALALSLHTACEVLDKALTVRSSHSRNPKHSGRSFTTPRGGIHVVKHRLFVP